MMYEEWQKQVKNLALEAGWQNAGVGQSYPLLGYEQGEVSLHYFYFPCDQVGLDELYIGTPLFFVSLNPQIFTLVNQVSYRDMGVAPFEAHTITVSPEKRAQNEQILPYFKESYDYLVKFYPHQPSGELGQGFLGMLKKLVTPPLWVYYEAMSPHFWGWLQGESR